MYVIDLKSCVTNKLTDWNYQRLSTKINEAKFVDNKCDWSAAKNWAQWWMRSNHLAMLHKDYSTMDDEVWDKCPSTTNAVECRNAECKQKQPIPLKMTMINH